jgi:phosphoglycerate kinase
MAVAPKIRSMNEITLAGRRVFIRLDLDVGQPDPELSLRGRARINAVVPTIRLALDTGARVILATHLSQEKDGKKKPRTLEPEGAYLAEALNTEVFLTDECAGDAAHKLVAELREGQVVLLENLDFESGERADDEAFAKELASFSDVYINDAFGACRYRYASLCTLPRLIPDRAIGLLMEKELRAATKIKLEIPRPFVVVMGGTKLREKMEILDIFEESADALIIGGAIANTFLNASGYAIGQSAVERAKVAWARSLLRRARERDLPILLPQDLQILRAGQDDRASLVAIGEVPADASVADLGPRTIKAYCDRILRAKSVLWYGPLGMCEKSNFTEATIQVAQAIAASSGFTVVGGDSTVAFVRNAGMGNDYSHVSEGGQSLLELLAGKPLPALAALQS